MPMPNKKLICLILAVIIIVAVVTFVIAYLWEKNHNEFTEKSDFEMADVLEWNGNRYKLRNNIYTVLVMGIDKFEKDIESTDGAYNNDSCVDFLTLIVVDRTAKTYSTIRLNRDTMTSVTVLGVGGKKIGKINAQLALSHTYGSGGDDSCRNTARAVSEVFGGLRVDRYVSFTMDAVAEINDMVGGVTLTVRDDLSMLDPALSQGETVTLNAEQALTYVRARSELEDSTNAARMERQHQYLNALYESLTDYIEKNDSFSTELINDLAEYMDTNCSADELDRLVNSIRNLERADDYALEGEYKLSDYVEFYPSEESIMTILTELFYEIK